ncbi:MAG TPA: toprim domain-containing protein, partial [Propionicimonas sp.]
TRDLPEDGYTDLCQAWVWRLSLLTDSSDMLDDDRHDPADEPPADLYTGWAPTRDVVDAVRPEAANLNGHPNLFDPWPDHAEDHMSDDLDDEQVLAIEGLIRNTMGVPEPADADVRHMMERADRVAESPVAPVRLTQVNELAAAYYQACLPDSWAQPYLTGRLRTDVTSLAAMRAGYAPHGWTGLVSHLRHHGVSDTEMLTAGVAQMASTGRLIDRFRDRAVFPIVHEGAVLGFVARRNPDFGDEDNHGPKYLNTATTPIFSKGDQLFIAGTLDGEAIPVLVEGPMDAIAVTLSGRGHQVGVAPLGTSLTEQQVAQLHRHGRIPVVATDADLAGRVAAERDYWLLAIYNIDATYAALPDGSDPADLVANGNTAALSEAIAKARPIAEALIDERLSNLEGAEAVLDAVCVLAAQPSKRWTAGVEHIAHHADLPPALVRSALASMVRAWNTDQRRAAQQALLQVAEVKDRLAAAQTARAVRGRHEIPMQGPNLHSVEPVPPSAVQPRRGVDL